MNRTTSTLLLVPVIGILAFGGWHWRAQRGRVAATASVTTMNAAADTVPPPLRGTDAPDSLVALRTVPIDLLERFETREYEYEVKAITVYGVQGNWYLVQPAAGGRAWLPASTPGRLIPIEELVVNGLNFLTEAWDGEVLDAPSAEGAVQEVPAVSRDGDSQVPANVVEARRAGGTLWFRVEVLDGSPCTADTTRVLASGWIRAWGPGGKPTAWFYSRGC